MTSTIPPDSWERVGRTVRTFREVRGMKPDELASAIGISRPYLANIEAGRKRLTPVLLARIAETLHVTQMAILDDQAAADAFLTACESADAMTVDQLADAAYTPTGPTREQLAARIRATRSGRGDASPVVPATGHTRPSGAENAVGA